MAAATELRHVTLRLCEMCARGAGGECHTPGCGHPTKSASDPDGGCPWGPSPCPDFEAARP